LGVVAGEANNTRRDILNKKENRRGGWTSRGGLANLREIQKGVGVSEMLIRSDGTV